MSKKDKIEDKIKDLNATRAMYHRDQIRNKIHSLEEKLEKIRKNPYMTHYL